MRATYGDSIEATYEVRGIPRDIEGAAALARRDKLEFEKWAVSLVDAQPNARQVGDRGVDGVARFHIAAGSPEGRILVSVKGGANNPGFVRDLGGTVEGHRAEMGVMVTLNPPTRGMLEAAASAGVYTHPSGAQYPKVQILAVEQLLKGERPNRPPMVLMPYVPGGAVVAERPVARQAGRRAAG